MIKVLGLALYGPLAASTRCRLGQYVPGLAAHGIDLQISHLLGDEYLRRRFRGAVMPFAALFDAGWRRMADLRNQCAFDAVILHCELFPLMPGWLERVLLRRPYVYDFDDALYLKYRTRRLRALRPILGGKFDRVMAGAAAITAGNHLLAEYAQRRNTNTHLFPTVVDTERYLPVRCSRGDMFTVGWIGSPSTAPYLSALVGPLSTIGREGPVRLVVIGGKAPYVPDVTVVEVEWQERTEVELINMFDVGVMPLPDDEWARGKCAFKLIQYMACAVPVIASSVGANRDVVQPDCGLLATTPQQWVDALRMLRDEPALREVMGQAGRGRVAQHYSLQRNLPVLTKVIREIVAGATS
ncbi:glycosyltransferase [Dokdonella soli]|uniref:Glycosyltransferase family 4 protein n=1 Tax=Dokdonella soli TaxID=529810 RepID=A0ABP3TK00_9GAMM